MIILPDGKALDLQSEIRSSLDLSSRLGSELKSSCKAFLDSPACVFSSETVHVTQGECAEIFVENNVQVLGSSDATTCVIAVLTDQPSGRAIVCHHDESTVKLAKNITQGIVPGMQSPELYLVGGALVNTDGCSTISFATVTTLLQVFHSLALPIRLKLFCALEWNTDPVTRAPRCQSLAVSLKNSPQGATFTATAFAVPPGGWKDRGPLIIPRLAQIWLNYSRDTHLRSVYDAEKDQWAIKLLEGAAFSSVDDTKETEESKTTAAAISKILEKRESNSTWIDSRVLELSNSELLRVCSTSPECELPHIAEEIRNCLQWGLAQRPPLRSVEHRYRLNKASKEWDKVFTHK
jgi:Protein N-terminal asparagine amidohydrolase